jgi:hypothetical protein
VTVTYESKDQRVTYCHTVSGDLWIELYAHNQTKVALLKEACLLALDTWMAQNQMQPIAPPTTTVEYDEALKQVRVWAEGIARPV